MFFFKLSFPKFASLANWVPLFPSSSCPRLLCPPPRRPPLPSFSSASSGLHLPFPSHLSQIAAPLLLFSLFLLDLSYLSPLTSTLFLLLFFRVSSLPVARILRKALVSGSGTVFRRRQCTPMVAFFIYPSFPPASLPLIDGSPLKALMVIRVMYLSRCNIQGFRI